ncbi:MAG: glycoside hydrolase family 6 protein [Nocardioidaceae bacterium]
MHHQSRRKAVRTKLALLTGVAASLVLVAAAQTASSAVGRTQGESGASRFTLAAGNPLAGRTWGVYKGDGDQAWEPYNHATGTRKQLLAKIALRPKAKWFGAWVPAGEITAKVRAYIANAQDGDPDALVQMTDFALKPWEDNACHSLPSAAEQAFYKRWTDNFAAGLGDAHVALILQPDGPFALCAPGGSKLPSHLLRYAAQRFSAHPNTSVYIEAGASDWLRDDPARALKILVPAGVAGVRGFALNGTHYVATARDIAFGTSVVKALAKQGIPDKHFVINTSSNGRPFAGYTYTGPNFDNARVCASRSDHRCVTLGIPPTTDVANPAWGLSDTNRANAAKYVDGYLWFGRPWLYNQADPFDMQRALQLVRTTPY